jgi:hypothetical protein
VYQQQGRSYLLPPPVTKGRHPPAFVKAPAPTCQRPWVSATRKAFSLPTKAMDPNGTRAQLTEKGSTGVRIHKIKLNKWQAQCFIGYVILSRPSQRRN